MGHAETIAFSLFGGLTLRRNAAGEPARSECEMIGKKLSEFFCFLIVNHGREIPSSELIDLFWAKNGKNPANSLKNYIFKVRAHLKKMFPEYDDVLVTVRGGYAWNGNISLDLDTERFASLCRECPNKPDNERLEDLMAAIRLYTGDMLPDVNSDWVQMPRTYYRSMYIDACRETLGLLAEQGRWSEAAYVSSRAYSFDPDPEEFSISFMQSMIKLGQPARAREHYEAYRQMLWNELGIMPSEKIDELFIEAGSRNAAALSRGEMIRLITQADVSEDKAELCSFTEFRRIAALEIRACRRYGAAASLAVISTGISDDLPPAAEQRRLERVLADGLRSGDSFARLDPVTYAAILPGADEKTGARVMEKIDRRLHKLYPRSKLHLQYQVIQVTDRI